MESNLVLFEWCWWLVMKFITLTALYIIVSTAPFLFIAFQGFVNGKFAGPPELSPRVPIPIETNIPLSVENKYQTRFGSLHSFRFNPEMFSVEDALQDYHREPIAFALALTELNTEVIVAIRKYNEPVLISHLRLSSLMRRKRDILGSDTERVHIPGLTFSQTLQYCKTEFSNFLNSSIARTLFPARFKHFYDPKFGNFWTEETLSAWEAQFQSFVRNVNFFCQHTGSEVDELAPLQETINNLRKFASDRRQELAPLLEVNARLNRELTSYKRINAALQTRHTIEKLVFELPQSEEYDNVDGSGPKWQVLWGLIWQDAARNENNPFHQLWVDSTGPYARENVREKGRNLFSDMSGEIHGYDGRQEDTFDYQHFSFAAQRVARTLHENPVVDGATGDINWGREIRKYPVNWPDANNLALSPLRQSRGRVDQLQHQLQVAITRRDELEARDAESRAAAESRKEALGDAKAPLDDSGEEDCGLDDLYASDVTSEDGAESPELQEEVGEKKVHTEHENNVGAELKYEVEEQGEETKEERGEGKAEKDEVEREKDGAAEGKNEIKEEKDERGTEKNEEKEGKKDLGTGKGEVEKEQGKIEEKDEVEEGKK